MARDLGTGKPGTFHAESEGVFQISSGFVMTLTLATLISGLWDTAGIGLIVVLQCRWPSIKPTWISF